MIYLTGCSAPEAKAFMQEGYVGQLRTPDIYANVTPGVVWAADNGCFNPKKFSFHRWKLWLNRQPRTPLWATVPDVVLDHEATLERWIQWVDVVKDMGFHAAFCAQDGCMEPPSDADCLFLGGSTEWKLSDDARALVDKAKEAGMLTHMGRVNSYRRFRLAWHWGCDSVDGTFLTFAPTENVERMRHWFRKLEAETGTSALTLF